MPDVQPLDPADPERLGDYRVLGRLGQGGQGVVFLARPAGGGEPVAVKLFHAQVTEETLARELEAAQQVARFCTAQVIGSGTVGDRQFIVSEYVDGPPLHQVVRAGGPRSGSALDRLAIATATALVALHDAGVVHRDFKPQNVLIGPDGPRVIDFGISRALSGAQTMVSRAVGTPAYMAPEQLQPGELGPAVDVFAWASTMVFAATGRPPFGNESIPIVLNRIAHGEPDLGGVEEPLRGLLSECLLKDPARRPTAQRVLDRLVRRSETAPGALGGAAATAAEAAAAARNVELERARQAAAEAVTAPRPPGPRPAGVGTGPPAAAGTGGGRRTGRLALAVAGAVAVAVVAVAVVVWPGGGGDRPAAGTGSSPSRSAGPVTQGGVPAVSGDSGRGTAGPSPSAGPRGSSARPTSRPRPGSPGPSRSTPPPQRVELGPGHFTAYCKHLGWEWVEYRESPQAGAYCVKRKGDTLPLTAARRDEGCRWRYSDPRARHFFKGKSNYCYAMR